MAFNRLGTPMDLDAIDFKSKDAHAIVCEHCGKKVGVMHKRAAKFSGSSVVMVAPKEFVCPRCGKTSKA